MTNEEAKFILHAYRPNGADASDPMFQSSLIQAKQDASLKAWFDEQQSFDRAVGAKLREVVPPAELRSAILAGAGVSRPKTLGRWYPSKWMAIAASVLLLLGLTLTGLFRSRANQSDNLPVFAVDYVASGFFLSKHDSNIDALRGWLINQKAPLPKEIPAGFAQLRGLGCKTLEYRGKEVSLICFGKEKEYHLFIARRDDFPSMSGRSAPEFLVRNGHAAATWSDETNQYVVVTDDSLNALKQCLGCQSS